MKKYSIYTFITVAACAFLLSCLPRPVGKCTYGENPPATGKVVIRSISKTKSSEKEYVKVSVEGFFKRDFFYTPEDFDRCFTAKGFKAGSEVEGVIISGGPCPPMYSIADCNTQ